MGKLYLEPPLLQILTALIAKVRKEGQSCKSVAILAPAFSADCVETLEEINEEIRDSFLESGGKVFTYIPCLNDRSDHIQALGKIIENELLGWL